MSSRMKKITFKCFCHRSSFEKIFKALFNDSLRKKTRRECAVIIKEGVSNKCIFFLNFDFPSFHAEDVESFV